MKIRILGWECQNIRRMENLRIDLRGEDKKPVSHTLLMMRNGTGKTTTLNLIRAALNGKAVEWKEREVRSYQPVDSNISQGRFTLQVSFDEDIYYYILHLDYENGIARYETSSAMMSGGFEEGRRLPLLMRGILDSENFVERFVFDGEQAKKTLNSGSREAENAIVYLYQLDNLDKLIQMIDDLVRKNQEQSVGGATLRSVRVYEGKYEKRKNIYDDLIRYRDKLSKDIEEMEKKKRIYEKEYQDIVMQDQQMEEEQEKLQREKDENEKVRMELVSGLMEVIKMPYNLQLDIHTRLKGLIDNMQVLKLPKTTAQEFFKELAEGKECVCGRCIGEREKKAILERAKEYLGQDSLSVVNSIKGTLKEYERDDTCEKLEESLRTALTREDQITGGLSRLAVKLAEHGHKDALQIQQKLEELSGKIVDLQNKLELLTTADYVSNTGLNQENNIPKALGAMNEARDNYLKASGTFEFTKKAEQMKRYILNVKANTLNKLKAYTVQETNKKLKQLISNDNVVIQKIDGHLVLENKEAVSEGQTLAVAYAYIGTLFEHSCFEFPFIVDTPAAPMDLGVRREVAGVIPTLFGQTIIFITSGEKQGFADMFYGREDVRYLTVTGEKDEKLTCILDKEYFVKYQEEKRR